MYPLQMQSQNALGHAVGYAVANTEGEHRELTRMGYEPPLLAEPQEAGSTAVAATSSAAIPAGSAPSLDELTQEAQALGIDVDGRWGAKRIAAEIAKAKA